MGGRVWLAIWIFLLAGAAHAHDGGGKSLVPRPARITSQQIEKMDLPQLQANLLEFDTLFTKLGAIRKRGGPPADEIAVIEEMGRFESMEAVGALTGRIYAEVRKEPDLISIDVIEKCLDILTEIASSDPVRQ